MHTQDTSPNPAFISNTWRQSGEDWTHRIEEATKKGKTLVLGGHGVTLRVQRGALIVKDGVSHSTHEPQNHTLYRGIHGIDRIVIVSPTGSVTFDALRWCAQQRIAVEVIQEEDGDEIVQSLSSVGGQETEDVLLRRAQYEARFNGRDLRICQWLISEKIKGQIGVLERLVPVESGKRKGIRQVDESMSTRLSELRYFLSAVQSADSVDVISKMEGGASTAYHRAVENIKVRWAVRDRKLVPEHWLVIGPRQSKLMYTRVSARYATNPANAIRNLAFTVLANQVRVAAAVKGFDLGCGWLHSDDRHRDTLVYDVMEPYRPVVDEKVIGLVTNARFTYGDFVTTKEGQVRLHPALAKFVVATCVIPWIEIDLSPVERLLLDE